MAGGAMDFEAALKSVGEFGRTQICQQVILNSLQFLVAMHMISLVYTGKEPSFHCKGHPEVSQEEVCKMSPPCEEYEYGTEFTSIVSEWDLVCDKSYKVGFAQSVFMAGVLFGNVNFGALSDRYGRLRVMLIVLAMLSTLGTLNSVVWSFQQFVVFRFLVGYGAGGVILCGFVLQTENLTSRYRALFGSCGPASFAVGVMLYAALAYFIRGWRTLILISSLPLSAYLLIYFVIPESPRWLVTQGRLTEAEDVLHEMGRMNGMQVPRSAINLSDAKKEKTDPNAQRYGLSDCFKTPVLRMRMMILIFSWFTCSMVYYGLTMNSGNLGSNMYISVALSGLVELPAYVIGVFMLDRVGRKKSMCLSMLVGGVSCLSLLFMSKDDPHLVNVRVAMALLGKMGISSAFNIVYIYSSELMPTVLRNTGLGICAMSARIGGIVAPQVLPMGETATFLIFGSTAFIGAILDMRLPETFNKPLPETIDDIETKQNVNIPAPEKENLLMSEMAEEM